MKPIHEANGSIPPIHACAINVAKNPTTQLINFRESEQINLPANPAEKPIYLSLKKISGKLKTSESLSGLYCGWVFVLTQYFESKSPCNIVEIMPRLGVRVKLLIHFGVLYLKNSIILSQKVELMIEVLGKLLDLPRIQ
jgi:hypothetical protein